MEVYRLTGEPISVHDARTREVPPRWKSLRVALTYADRAALYARIDARVEEMVRAGLFDEVSRLLDAGLSPDCTAMQAIGYKEAVLALRGELMREEALHLIRQNSRRYAKRQLTWFRRWDDALRILFDDEPDFESARQLSTAFLLGRGYAVCV